MSCEGAEGCSEFIHSDFCQGPVKWVRLADRISNPGALIGRGGNGLLALPRDAILEK